MENRVRSFDPCRKRESLLHPLVYVRSFIDSVEFTWRHAHLALESSLPSIHNSKRRAVYQTKPTRVSSETFPRDLFHETHPRVHSGFIKCNLAVGRAPECLFPRFSRVQATRTEFYRFLPSPLCLSLSPSSRRTPRANTLKRATLKPRSPAGRNYF